MINENIKILIICEKQTKWNRRVIGRNQKAERKPILNSGLCIFTLKKRNLKFQFSSAQKSEVKIVCKTIVINLNCYPTSDSNKLEYFYVIQSEEYKYLIISNYKDVNVNEMPDYYFYIQKTLIGVNIPWYHTFISAFNLHSIRIGLIFLGIVRSIQ